MDSKREELRTLVGERYRDLMEAANTIAQVWSLTNIFSVYIFVHIEISLTRDLSGEALVLTFSFRAIFLPNCSKY